MGSAHLAVFRIKDLPIENNRPAMAELVLPDDFEFPDGGMMPDWASD